MYLSDPFLATLANSKIPQPPPGTNVWWFANAEKNSTPFPAKVLENNGQGRLRLWVLTLDGRQMVKQGVWWMGDPTLGDSDRTARSLAGGWDYIPELPAPDMRTLTRPKKAARELTDDDIHKLKVLLNTQEENFAPPIPMLRKRGRPKKDDSDQVTPSEETQPEADET